jgi:hypothetical protein
MHLIDFGLSVLNTKKQSNKIVGTHEFMSINSHLKMLLFLVFRLIFIGKQNKYTTNKIEIIQYIMTLK